jgi:hypothetical protein
MRDELDGMRDDAALLDELKQRVQAAQVHARPSP